MIHRKISKIIYGSLGIALTWDWTHFLKILFVFFAAGGFYSYYIHQWNKADKERKIVRKKLSFMHAKRLKNGCKRKKNIKLTIANWLEIN